MNRTRLMLSLLGLAACALLIWFGGPLLAIGGHAFLESIDARLIAILLLMLLCSVVIVVRVVRARRAEHDMAQGIVASPAQDAGDAHLAAVLPRVNEELETLRTRLREAMDLLRRSGRKSGAKLHELPWYIIIGPPGAGKTTALQNSGLRFPLAERFGNEALPGVGGTRNCDWWFTDEAVLLDTAGRYVTQDSDETADAVAWNGFLDLLRHYRKRRPINGIIVAVSLADMLTQDRAQRAQHARTIKQRIEELNARLGLRFPVYLMFTKADLLAGFADFFDDLGSKERSQVWGMSFDAKASYSPSVFADEFERLMRRLNDRMLWRLDGERDPARRALLFAFPQQIASLKDELGDFLRDIFAASHYEEPFWLRGAYFTSAVQHGAPIDRLMGSVARVFGLDAQRYASPSGGRSYFVADLLKRVIFAEAGLVGSNRRIERRRAWLHGFTYAAAALCVVGAITAWTTAYSRNQAYITQVGERAAAYEQLSDQTARSAEAGLTLEQLSSRFDRLAGIGGAAEEAGGFAHIPGALGLDQQPALDAAARSAYAREMNRTWVPRIASDIAQVLRGAERQSELKYAALKAYLMLAQPQHLDPTYLRAWMQLSLQRQLPQNPDHVRRLLAHFDALLAAGIEPISGDASLISDARRDLNRVPLAQLAYDRIKHEAEVHGVRPLSLRDMIGTAVSNAFVRKSGAPPEQGIPGLYTYRGYAEDFVPQSHRLTQILQNEAWVLGNERGAPNGAELAALNDDVATLYFADYARQWSDFLTDLTLPDFRSPAQGLDVLAQMSGRNSVLRALLSTVERNTRFTRLADGEAVAAAASSAKSDSRLAQTREELARVLNVGIASSKSEAISALRPGAAVESRFADLDALTRKNADGVAPLDAIIDQLAKLYAELDTASASDLSDPQHPEHGSAARLLKETAVQQPQPLKDWLLRLSENANRATDTKLDADVRRKQGEDRKTLIDKINVAWKSDVLPFCNAAIANRYPLDKHSSTDATLKDFSRMFAPGGLIDAFVKDNLKPYIDMSGEHWKWRAANDIDLGARPDTLRQLETAARIRDAFFRDGTPMPAIEFALKPVLLDPASQQVSLTFGEQKFAGRPGTSHLQTLHWPAADGSLQATMSFEDGNGKSSNRSFDGPWALFRLFDQAALDVVAADRIVATFQTQGHSAQLELHAASVVNPFQQDALSHFQCPKGI